MTYSIVCGAEIHVELKTKSKMFCGCKNDPFGAPKPNIYTCPVCLGMPGGLPVPNKQAIEDVIKLGLAFNCEIPKVSHFDRKHYFYPDLPKSYQISQKDEPFCLGGYVDTSFGRVRLNHIHLEEDAAKMHHEVVDGKKVSLIDFNRSSVPLVEIVTEPDIKSVEQAKEFLKKVRDIVRAVGVSDCDMEKGSMRLEANVSLTKDGSLPPYKVEVKNINSFRFYGMAMEYEAKRQQEILEKGETPIQETRGFREGRGTVSQRGKEGLADYRYMPDPDLPPITISEQWLNSIKKDLPILPGALEGILLKMGVDKNSTDVIAKNKDMYQYISHVEKIDKNLVKKVAADIVNKKFDWMKIKPEAYLEELKSKQSSLIVDENILKPIIEKVIADSPSIVAQYQAGKTGVLGFFVGNVMKATQGKADPSVVNKLLSNMLK